ncbi:MAG: HAD family hydrolase [Planctomycetaceae bacterium]
MRKSSEMMMEKVELIVVDKTGTLTQGNPEVTQFVTINSMEEEEILRLVLAIESQSEHPLRSLMRYGERKRIFP